MPALVLDGRAVHYRMHTASPPCAGLPLMLVHGAGGNLMHWPGELRRLPGRVVVALDLPGHGHSGGLGLSCRKENRPALDIGAYAQVVGRVAGELGLGKFVAAGHSMGGAIALELALRCPEMLAGLVLVASSARLPVAPDLLNALLNNHEAAIDILANWSQGEFSDASTVRIYLQRLREVNPEVLSADYAACSAWDRTADLGQISIPTLVICGDADRMIPFQLGMDLQQGIRTSQLLAVPGAGHMVMLEQPALVAGAVQRFITGLSSV